MTSPSGQRRIDAAEVALTPKEWAIRLVEDFRKHPTRADYYQSSMSKTADEDVGRPYNALMDQAEARHPGKKPEDIRARNKLTDALRTEYRALFRLAVDVNEDVARIAEVNGLKAALKLADLRQAILQDAFGRTARKAAEWIQEYKTADADEEENRQIMLKELAAYSDVDFGEKWGDSLPIAKGVRIRFPSVIENWVAVVSAAVIETLGYRAAVKTVQDKHFDGHPILFRDTEANLDAAIDTLEASIGDFNDYLKIRADLFKAEWEAEEEGEDGIASAIPGEREGKLTIDIDAVRKVAAGAKASKIAADWTRLAKFKAKTDMLPHDAEHDAKMTALYFDIFGKPR